MVQELTVAGVGGNNMARTVFILTLLFGLTLETASAHQDFRTTVDHGNVRTSIVTGFKFEEINKVNIIGELAEKLASKLHYSEPIYLDFWHDYARWRGPIQFVSFEKDGFDPEVFDKECIVIRFEASDFNVENALKLLEYSIENLQRIKDIQGEVKYLTSEIYLTSIDTAHINEALRSPKSSLVKQLMNLKIQRPEDVDVQGFSYYWQSSKYHFYEKTDTIQKEGLTINEIRFILRSKDNSLLIFETDSSFYFVSDNLKDKVSSRHVIPNAPRYLKPFDVGRTDDDSFTISFYDSSDNRIISERRLTYFTTTDEMIEEN